MKVGTSLSRCVRDIVQGRVDINDVLVVIARTDFDPRSDEQWQNVWRGYRQRSGWSAPEWDEFDDEQEDQVRSVTIELYETGRLHQPRQFGQHVSRVPYVWLETVLVPEDLDNNVAAKDAWQQFQIVAGLSNVTVTTEL
jgi:hypothetical protein